MASWVLAHPPWHTLARIRLRWNYFAKASPWTSRQFLNTPPTAVETPAMRDVKAYPYPETALDGSLFEEPTDEYHHAAEETDAHVGHYPLPAVVNHPSAMVQDLIKNGMLQDAARVRDELVHAGVEIPPHPIYIIAARQTLHTTGLSHKDRLDAFTDWWSLIPSRTEVDHYRDIVSILVDLLRYDIAPDIALIIRFALLAASKGYARAISPEVIPMVARYANSEATVRFLESLYTAAQAFESANGPRPLRPRKTSRPPLLLFRDWCYLAMRELVTIGRTRVALDVLQMAHARDLRFPPAAYRLLAKAFQQERDVDGMNIVRSLSLSSLDPAPTTGSHHGARNTSANALTGTCVIMPDDHETPALVKTARLLGRSLAAGRLPISAIQLSGLISTFLKADRRSLVRRLRQRAYKQEHLIAVWTLAEMMRHAFLKRPVLTIIKEYEASLHMVGVPRGVVDQLWRNRRDEPMKAARSRPALRRKVHPSHEHSRIVWEAFLRRARSRTQVQKLYLQLLEEVTLSREVPLSVVPFTAMMRSWQSTSDSADDAHPIAPPSLYNAHHFALFMKAFRRFGLPAVAARVIVDMYVLGIKPN
ncbi:hypothetical protein BD413DRAFT_438395, partial [Trametes elegans]